MKKITVNQLKELIRNNNYNEINKIAKSLTPKAISNLILIVGCEDKVERELETTREVQYSIKASAFILACAGVFGILVGANFQDEIYDFFIKNKWVIKYFIAFIPMAMVNVYDSLKNYTWMEYILPVHTQVFDENYEDLAVNDAQILEEEEVEEVEEVEEELKEFVDNSNNEPNEKEEYV